MRAMDFADQSYIYDPAEAARRKQTNEAEAKRLQEAEAKRVQDEAVAKRIHDEAEAKRMRDEADARRLMDAQVFSPFLPQCTVSTGLVFGIPALSPASNAAHFHRLSLLYRE